MNTLDSVSMGIWSCKEGWQVVSIMLQDIPPRQVQQGLAVSFMLPAILEEHSKAREKIYHGRKGLQESRELWNTGIQKELSHFYGGNTRRNK